jgi:hypothetical protein
MPGIPRALERVPYSQSFMGTPERSEHPRPPLPIPRQTKLCYGWMTKMIKRTTNKTTPPDSNQTTMSSNNSSHASTPYMPHSPSPETLENNPNPVHCILLHHMVEYTVIITQASQLFHMLLLQAITSFTGRLPS